MANLTDRKLAHASLATHSFEPKLGYINHGGAPLPHPGPHPANRCSPPAGAKDGSLHLLNPPGGDAPITFKWVAGQRVWACVSGAIVKAHRLGYTDVYLSRAGWTYRKPAT